jgi:hypothetical protein
MAEQVSEIDLQIVEDLRSVEQGCQILGSCGARAEFWESFTLLKIGRDAYQAEVERIEAQRKLGVDVRLSPEISQKLSFIKTELAPLARQLREFLSKSTAGILDGMKQDLALVFLMGSVKARAAVARWVKDPEGTAAESSLKLKILSKLVDGYRRALLDARKQGAPVRSAPDTTIRNMRPTTIRLKPEFVDDLRLVEQGRKLFESAEEMPSWNLICLILMQRDETRRTIEELRQLKTSGKPGEFAGALARLRGQLKQIREQFDSVALPVGAYLKTIFGKFEGPADELALAFLIASSQGRHRARQWLDDPELCRGEATASMNGLRSRAVAYLDALANNFRGSAVTGA